MNTLHRTRASRLAFNHLSRFLPESPQEGQNIRVAWGKNFPNQLAQRSAAIVSAAGRSSGWRRGEHAPLWVAARESRDAHELSGLVTDVSGGKALGQSIIQDLRSGKNVVLALPRFAPVGLRDAVAARVRDNDLWRWRPVYAAEFDGECPLHALYGRFAPAGPPSELRSALSLAQQLAGDIIWIEGPSERDWLPWEKFLIQYQHACQAIDLVHRSLFCVPMVGRADLARGEVALVVRRWEGMIRRLDLNLLLDGFIAGKFPHPLHQKVAVGVVTELAGWDLELARRLARLDLSAILSPLDELLDFATARGWTAQAFNKTSAPSRRMITSGRGIDGSRESRPVHKVATCVPLKKESVRPRTITSHPKPPAREAMKQGG